MRRLIAACLCTLSLTAFEYQPWFHEILEFQWQNAYMWRHYNDVDSGFNPTNYSSTDQWIDTGFQVSPFPTIDAQIEMNFADTDKHSWSYLSTAMYVRYLLLDDVAGDPISWTVGGLIRLVNSHFLNDVSIPYHANLNLELNTAIGKEFDELYNWVFRIWGLAGAGIGNRGAPWITTMLNVEGNAGPQNMFQAFLDGYFGLGGKSGVNVDNFPSYANLSHQSLDLGFRYRYTFDVWGAISAAYAFRVFARNYPEYAHTVRVEYRLPFSLF